MTREKFIQAARKWAKRNGLAFDLDTKLGKGSHYRLTIGDPKERRVTTLKSGRYTPVYIRIVCRQLGIPPDEV